METKSAQGKCFGNLGFSRSLTRNARRGRYGRTGLRRPGRAYSNLR